MTLTTCGNGNCEKYGTCTVNIWTHEGEMPACYMSKKQAIYSNYVQKCEKAGEVPMSSNIYFEDAFSG